MAHRQSDLVRKLCLALLLALPILAEATDDPAAGAACVIAKKLGNSLDIAWTTEAASVADAIHLAKQALRRRGYSYLFPQANSDQPHGWMVIIKTAYLNARGRPRTSYGCGFSPLSEMAAEQDAVDNLRSYSWGWRSDFGYQVVEKTAY